MYFCLFHFIIFIFTKYPIQFLYFSKITITAHHFENTRLQVKVLHLKSFSHWVHCDCVYEIFGRALHHIYFMID